jgi:hypothetical protein
VTQPAPQAVPPTVVPAFLTWTDDTGLAQQFQCFSKSRDLDIGSDVTEHPVETGSDVTDNVRRKLRELSIFFFESNAPIDANNWASPVLGLQVVTVAAPPPPTPIGPTEFEAWDNLFVEKALAGQVGGMAGTALGGSTGGAVGALGGNALVSLLGGSNGGIPVPMVVGPPQPAQPPVPQVVSLQVPTFPSLAGSDYIALTVQLLEALHDAAQIVNVVAPHYSVSNLVIDHIHVHEDDQTGIAAEIEVHLKEIRFVSTVTVPAPAPSLPRAKPMVNKGEQNNGDATPQTQSVASSALSAIKALLR